MTIIALGAVAIFGIWWFTGGGCKPENSTNGVTGPEGSLCFDMSVLGINPGGGEPPVDEVPPEDEAEPEDEEPVNKVPLVSRFPGKNPYAGNLAQAYAASLQDSITIA